MKDFYKKYINVIVCTLFILLLFKSCQSCARYNSMEWNKIQYIQETDSLKELLQQKDVINGKLKDSLNLYKEKIILMEDQNKLLKNTNKSQQNINSILIEMNKQINKKDNI